MDREQLYKAISELTMDRPMAWVALANAMTRLDTVQLGELLDFVAEVHEVEEANKRSQGGHLAVLSPAAEQQPRIANQE